MDTDVELLKPLDKLLDDAGFMGYDEKGIVASGLGFGADIKSKEERQKIDLLKEIEPHDILKFGLIPELVGRLPVITTTEPLTRDMLVRILTEPKNAFVRQYRKLMALDGVELHFEQEALEYIADCAVKRNTGARGLRAIIEEIMSEIMFEVPSNPSIVSVTITKECAEKKEPPLIVYDPEVQPVLTESSQTDISAT